MYGWIIKNEMNKASKGTKKPPEGFTLAPSGNSFSYFPPEG
jgi:hypothetical protein